MFTTTEWPRFTDCDGLGHVSNTILPVWFEEARTPLFKICNPSLKLETWNLILKRVEYELFHQIWHNQKVTIETELEQIGTTSMVVTQRAYQNDHLVASGRTVLIFFDYNTQKPSPIPGTVRGQLEPHIAEPTP